MEQILFLSGLLVLVLSRPYKLKSRDWYKVVDPAEYEKRRSEYQKIILEMCAEVKQRQDGHRRPLRILEYLSQLRGSIFFDEAYRKEYDALWIACLGTNPDLTDPLMLLCQKLRG